MSILTRLKVIAGKVESTKGTAETLTASEATMVISQANYTPDIVMVEREILSASLSKFSALSGTKAGAIAVRTELKGAAAAGTAPKIGEFLKAAGFSETVVASTSVTYNPISTGVETITVGEYSDDDASTGLRHLIAGAAARSCRISGNVGEPMFVDMEFFGKYQDTTDVAPLAPTLDTLAPPVLLGATFTIGGYAANISNITIDYAPSVALRSDITEATGWDHALIVDRTPTISFDAEQPLVATYDFLGIMKAATEGALSLAYGSDAGNTITITAPKVQYTSISEGDRNGIATFQVEGRLNRDSSADDELVIAFT